VIKANSFLPISVSVLSEELWCAMLGHA